MQRARPSAIRLRVAALATACMTAAASAPAAAAPVEAAQASDEGIGKVRVDVAFAPFVAKGGVDLRGESRFRYRIHPLLDLAVQGRAGMLRADSDAKDRDTLDQPTLSLAAGAVVHTRPARDTWEFAGSLLLAHVHHATLASWKRTPAANLAGDSAGSVRHRSGLEVFAAATAPAIAQLGDYGLLLGADACFTWLPTSPALQTSAGVRITLGLRWQPPPSRPSLVAANAD